LVPVLIGSSIAYHDGYFNWLYFLITVACSLLIQIITNYINELYDYRKGADTKERVGPLRIVSAGIVSPKQMAIVSAMLILITLALGMVLVAHAGLPILIIGLVSILMAYAYTGGPYPLAYKGLGDIFVLIFFGLVATVGTYYVLAMKFSYIALLASFAPGFFSMNILGVNNIRDIDTDRKVGKMTLQAKLGEKKSKQLYYALNYLSFVIPFLLYFVNYNYWLLLPILLQPSSTFICKRLKTAQGAELNKLLADTGKILVLYGILLSAGFIISTHTMK
jgi:1,4-dihydroxy-2-naphthoate octaprenyltransferase